MNIQRNLLFIFVYTTISYRNILVESSDTLPPPYDNRTSSPSSTLEKLLDAIVILTNRLNEVKHENQILAGNFDILKKEFDSLKLEYEALKNFHSQDSRTSNNGNVVNLAQMYQSASNLLGFGLTPFCLVPLNLLAQGGPGYVNPSNGQAAHTQGPNYSELLELAKKLKKENEKLKKEVIENRTPIRVNINSEEATREFCYENDTYRHEKIFTARKGFGICEVVGYDARGEEGYIWKANDNSEYVRDVVLSLADTNSQLLTINGFDGSQKIFRRNDNIWSV